MRKLILLLTFLLLFWAPQTVTAQNQVQFNTVSVNIWPEYDQPSVLMVYGIELAPATMLPATLTVHIPAGAQINAVAVVDPQTGLINAPYNSTIQGAWDELDITTNSSQLQIEYYLPLVKSEITRHVVFSWFGDYSVNLMDVNFLEPFGAEDVKLSVTPMDISPGQDGLTNYHVQESNLTAGTKFNMTIDYQRNTNDLSISSLPVQAASTPGPDTPGRVSMTGALPWVLAGLGVLLIFTGIFGFAVWQRSGRVAPAKVRHPVHDKASEDNAIYCSQCGNRAQPGDVFCRTCGTRLMKD